MTEVAGGTITDLNVCLNIQHTWPGDLVVTLTHGTKTVHLMKRPGATSPNDPGCSQDDVFVYLNDGAPDSVQEVCDPVPLRGVFSPAEALSDFNGQDRSGTWTLTVSDREAGDTGELTGFSMTFVTATPAPTGTP